MSWSAIIQARPQVPVLPGAELEPYPYLSGYGLMQRVTRLACPQACELGKLGFRNHQVADVLLATQRRSTPTQGLLHILGLRSTALATYWRPATWSPIQTGDLFGRQARPVRQCPSCARYGYHCALFQLPSITHCPWHGCWLEERCRQCGNPWHARFDQQAKLGICSCGADLFDPVTATVNMWDFPTAQAEGWLEEYLKWAVRRRASRWLCVPEACTHWDDGYALLAAPPPSLQAPQPYRPWSTEVFSGHGADPAPRQFWGWSSWGGERPLTVAPLPATIYPKLCEATKSIMFWLPYQSRTPFELVEANNLRADATLRENVFLRPDCFISPRGPGGASTWLNLSTVDGGIAAFIGQVLDLTAKVLRTNAPLQDRSLQAERSHAIDQLDGRRHLSDALEHLLTSAYRWGLEAILRSKLSEHPELLPAKTWPILELVGRSGRLRSVRLISVRDKPLHIPTASAPKAP